MLVDSHCHLDFPDFDEDRDAIVERAKERGVGILVTICTRVAHFDKVHALTARYDNVFCSVGTHPNNADEEPDVPIEKIVALADHDKVVAIGEAGLDYHYDRSSPANQQKGLIRHIEAARETDLPLVIHARNADRDMIDILERESGKGAFPAILHCYSSGHELARIGVDLGFYLSFSGILTFKNAQEIRDIAAEIPLDRLLVETDAPFLAPTPKRGKRNEPSFTLHTAEKLAETRGLTFEEIEDATTDNFFRVFKKVPDPRQSHSKYAVAGAG